MHSMQYHIWPSNMSSDKDKETFYTGKGYQPIQKEGFREEVYPGFAICADSL